MVKGKSITIGGFTFQRKHLHSFSRKNDRRAVQQKDKFFITLYLEQSRTAKDRDQVIEFSSEKELNDAAKLLEEVLEAQN